VIERTGNLAYDLCQSREIVARVRDSRIYAQNLYAAMCNQAWQEQQVFEILADRTWSCSWRTAGAIVADMRGKGDYLDWYCSGLYTSNPDDDLGTVHPTQSGYVVEGTITPEILADLAGLGWHPVEVDQDCD
jgi:hypothetical protein